tara:strand:- start:3432 stop:3860 length:429 start_codon:yes stop_codon:yes gene_type:complete
MYAPVTFPLIIASEKGKGKSVRAERFSYLMPEGWTSENGANSARAGMNGTLAYRPRCSPLSLTQPRATPLAGNNSPSNGTQVQSDEMDSDLVPAQCTERMEFIKTVVGCALPALQACPCLQLIPNPVSLSASASSPSSARAT